MPRPEAAVAQTRSRRRASAPGELLFVSAQAYRLVDVPPLGEMNTTRGGNNEVLSPVLMFRFESNGSNARVGYTLECGIPHAHPRPHGTPLSPLMPCLLSCVPPQAGPELAGGTSRQLRLRTAKGWVSETGAVSAAAARPLRVRMLPRATRHATRVRARTARLTVFFAPAAPVGRLQAAQEGASERRQTTNGPLTRRGETHSVREPGEATRSIIDSCDLVGASTRLSSVAGKT